MFVGRDWCEAEVGLMSASSAAVPPDRSLVWEFALCAIKSGIISFASAQFGLPNLGR